LDRNDRFWMTHKGSPFPTVAEAIQEELESYRNSEEEIKRLKTSMGIEGESDIAFSLVNDTTARLTNAVNSLPQLMEKKRLIDMHTKIATAILNFIKARRLDSYFEIEEKVMSKQTLDRPLLDLLRDGEFGQAEDKLRLYIIYFICERPALLLRHQSGQHPRRGDGGTDGLHCGLALRPVRDPGQCAHYPVSAKQCRRDGSTQAGEKAA